MVAPLALLFLLFVVGAVVVLGTAGEARAQAVSFDYTGNIVTYTIPVSGVYDMTAMGASGYSPSYSNDETLGKTISASGFFRAGTLINIAVGEMGHGGSGGVSTGGMFSFSGNGGGGGTFVYTGNAVRDAAPIIIAGGGGGGSSLFGIGGLGTGGLASTGMGGMGNVLEQQNGTLNSALPGLPSLVVSAGGSITVVPATQNPLGSTFGEPREPGQGGDFRQEYSMDVAVRTGGIGGKPGKGGLGGHGGG